MFNTVLIANRGAIAVRIIRTLKKLGIQSVAVYAQSDQDSLHVKLADLSLCLGEGPATDTYLDQQKLIRLALEYNVQAIHPGYGFLSENADFARLCDANNICFIGPTPEQIDAFGLKHTARSLAQAAGVPLLPGSDLLDSADDAVAAANAIGFPVMLKSTAGGGGIGMQLCQSEDELRDTFESVKRLGANNFSNDGVFIEKYITRARHIEVQIFGNGLGQALAIGERDCSSQRRNQKVVEECPAPNLDDSVRSQLHSTAESLCESIAYRNAGTVEFVVDADTQDFYFLEVNARLQVEHGVTEQVYGIDLVAWMVGLASKDPQFHNNDRFKQLRAELTPEGHAVQVRLYAEDPHKDFQPCADLLSDVYFPDQPSVRVETWVESGITVSPYFDPMLAKVIAHGQDRETAFKRLHHYLGQMRLYGTESNLDYLRQLSVDPVLLLGNVTTRYLNDFTFQPSRVDVLSAGTLTTIQDAKGRTGYWNVGVPPSGPFDGYSFELGNRILGNDSTAAGLEITLQGPTLKFSRNTQLVITGADIDAKLNGIAIKLWQVVTAKAGQTLSLGRIAHSGARSYLCVQGGFQCPSYLGSLSTFTLGKFGGHNGRALRAGDVLKLDAQLKTYPMAKHLDPQIRPSISHQWTLRVVYGPHGAPDFFTDDDIDEFFSTQWEVHYNSSRTGVRLIGPKPQWARKDGGEAGLHPSNIHDNAYAFGTVDFTGDMPVILGPDGPSLGGFVCPATVIQADLWKLGQLRAGDKIRFQALTIDDALAANKAQRQQIDTLMPQTPALTSSAPGSSHSLSPILNRLNAAEYGDDVVYRACGDHFLLIEYGEQILDLRLRFRVHALMQWMEEKSLLGVRELTPGIRSLQVHFDPTIVSHQELLRVLESAEQELSKNLHHFSVPSRIVHLPLSWDDASCRQAIEKYDQSVRSNAPWAPNNIEFIRRINGLASVNDVKNILFDASYLVMGLGDVYLGAPVATPVNPKHRLVTTKYNPARTWTAENSVGIGGSYLCVYGMEGPGGYQLLGRTLQMWNRYQKTNDFTKPWLLRFFDQIRFYEVSNDELEQIRQDFPQGRHALKIEECHFSFKDYQALLETEQPDIDRFAEQRRAAFQTELQQWHATGQFNHEVEEQSTVDTPVSWQDHQHVVESTVSGTVWQTLVEQGQTVRAGDPLIILESMKMEVQLSAHHDGTVSQLLCKSGQRVDAGQVLAVIEPIK